MANDGYLLIRSLQKKEAVPRARRTILEHLRDQDALDPDSPLMQGRIAPDRGPAGGYAGDFYQRSLQSSPGIVNLARSKEIMGFLPSVPGRAGSHSRPQMAAHKRSRRLQRRTL